MFTSLPEQLRKNSVNSLFEMKTFSNSWPIWRKKIHTILGNEITPSKLINLGDNLSDIFTTTGGTGRTQSSLSGGGAAWEALVTWYINLCTVGTRVIAIKKMSLVPEPIQFAITVNYGNSSCNTESDITVIVFPDQDNYTKEISLIKVKDIDNNEIPILKKGKFNYKPIIDNLARQDFERYEIGIVQCKTNWNDNAQIPMLWDMIYSANGFKNHKITIGREGYSIKGLASFTYSFVTVPSNKRANYKSTSVAVKRVTNLSGGNYWGKATEQHIARSLKEMFNNNFQNGFPKGNLRNNIARSLPYLKADQFEYFRLF